jgi:hypothetical protein
MDGAACRPGRHEILGAAILGTGGDEAIHSILNVMYARAPYTVIQRAMHIHPTVSELIPTMLGEIQPLSDAAESRAVSAAGVPGQSPHRITGVYL